MWNRIKNVHWSYWLTGLLSLFVLQWFGVRIGEMRVVLEPGNPSSKLGPAYYFLCGWALPLTGYFGIREIHVGRRWMLRLHRATGRPWIVRFPRRRST